MLGAYFTLGVFGLLACGLVGWVIAGEVGERRKARGAAQVIERFQRVDHNRDGDEP